MKLNPKGLQNKMFHNIIKQNKSIQTKKINSRLKLRQRKRS